MDSSRMRTTRLLTVSHVSQGGEGLPNPQPPRCRPLGHVTCDARWEANPPLVDRMTDTCENITLPQTSFVGGNNWLKAC